MKRSFYSWMQLLGWGFFMFFLVWYIGQDGISVTSLVIEGTTKANQIFNIVLWGILTLFSVDKFFGHLKND